MRSLRYPYIQDVKNRSSVWHQVPDPKEGNKPVEMVTLCGRKIIRGHYRRYGGTGGGDCHACVLQSIYRLGQLMRAMDESEERAE